jgi:hypothetical protein
LTVFGQEERIILKVKLELKTRFSNKKIGAGKINGAE